MDIRKMTDEEIVQKVSDITYGKTLGNWSTALAQFIRQRVKDSTPDGLTVEEIEKILDEYGAFQERGFDSMNGTEFDYAVKELAQDKKNLIQAIHAAQERKEKDK